VPSVAFKKKDKHDMMYERISNSVVYNIFSGVRYVGWNLHAIGQTWIDGFRYIDDVSPQTQQTTNSF
jgi:hypothetical protein